jgi:hypothetical protein
LYDPVEVATFYVAMFPARDDVYSVWTPELQGWRPVREPLTPQIILAGLTKAGPAISGYMISPDSFTHSLAIDFDTPDGLEQGFAVAAAMGAAGLPAYVETSRRGSHLWLTLDGQVSAKVARRALRAFLATALADPEDVHIEIRPGSDTIAPGGLGHALRLPFMPHPKTGVTPQFMDASGTVMGPTIAAALLDIKWGEASIITDWSKRWSPVTTRISKAYADPKDFGPDEYENASASQILRELWGADRAVPGRSIRCPAHDDKVASLSILRDDRRVICKSPSCPLNNGDHGRGTFELTRLAIHV